MCALLIARWRHKMALSMQSHFDRAQIPHQHQNSKEIPYVPQLIHTNSWHVTRIYAFILDCIQNSSNGSGFYRRFGVHGYLSQSILVQRPSSQFPYVPHLIHNSFEGVEFSFHVLCFESFQFEILNSKSCLKICSYLKLLSVHYALCSVHCLLCFLNGILYTTNKKLRNNIKIDLYTAYFRHGFYINVIGKL